MTGGPTGTDANKFTFGLDAGQLYTQYVEYFSTSNSYIASSYVKAAGVADTSPYTWMLVAVSYNWVAGQTDIELTKDGNSEHTATEPEQFSDIKDPSHVKNIIGAQLDQANAYGPINFFSGDVWEVFLVNSKLTGSEISSGINTSLLPVLDGCDTWGQYLSTGDTPTCTACTIYPNDSEGDIEVGHNLCSTCINALCTQCTGSGEGMCTKCKSMSTLTNDGNCYCSPNSSDDGTGNCSCNTYYKETEPGVCTECRNFLKA